MSHLESRWHHCMKFGICKNVLDFDAKTSEGTFEKNRYTWMVSFCPRKLFAHGAGSSNSDSYSYLKSGCFCCWDLSMRLEKGKE